MFQFISLEIKAQTKDTVLLLEVPVTTTKLNSAMVGKKIQTVDSTTLQLFKNQSLADLLSSSTPVFIKNYGPGALATTSFRGGNASQTAILWNGLNIQNSMLGQVDLSSISNNLFNQIDIEYGGSSALWGSGAMGGAIHLNNQHQFNKGFSTKLNYMIGEVGSKTMTSDIIYSSSKYSFSLKAFGLVNKNQFSYFNKDSNKILKYQHANYDQVSALPEFKFYLSPFQSLTASAWLTKANRNFPNTNSSLQNKITQKDESNRVNVNWNYSKSNFTSNFKTAYFLENLNYTDSIAKINSRSKMNTIIMESDNYYRWHKDQTLNVGSNFTINKAASNNYTGTKELDRIAFIAGNKGSYFAGKLILNTTLRIEHSNTNLNPFTYNAGIDYFATNSLTLKLSAGKVYRLPTLNDLYWYPGGNINLKPEQGYTADGTIEFAKTIDHFSFNIQASAFNKLINNWILWLPGNTSSSPMNIQEVWSRGTESSTQLTYTNEKFYAQLKFISGYVLSTIKKSDLENDNTTNRQLIYTPRYNFNAIITIAYNKLILSYFHNYIGYRFTSSDNSTWLDPYHYSTLRLMYSYKIMNMNFGVFSNINNILNNQFEVMTNRPMPLRNIEIGINLNYSKKPQNI